MPSKKLMANWPILRLDNGVIPWYYSGSGLICAATRPPTPPERKAAEIIKRFDARLIELSEAMDADLEEVKERLAAVQSRIRRAAADFDPDLPERPQAEPDGDQIPEYAWLYRSQRDYLEQNEVYKSRKAGTMQD